LAVVWTNGSEEQGFDETTGELKLARGELAGLGPAEAVGLVGHEVRHVWQWEVIERRIESPGGERAHLTHGYSVYDADNAFKYQNNGLESDARDRAAYVVEGFSE